MIAALALLAVYGAIPALAVHDTGFFELDGNATNQSLVPGDDWDNVCHQVLGTDCSTSSNTTGATGVSFSDDRTVTTECAGGDNCTVFTGGGSKDPSDISSWNWKTDSGGLPAKDNLQQGFAARYSAPASSTCPTPTGTGTCSVVYFGSTRVANNGDAQQGVWFLQNQIGLDPNGSFTSGASDGSFHLAGDVLIVSDFSTGGATAKIDVYKWVDSGGDISTHIQSLGGTPAGGTAECGATTPATGDPFCGLVNPADGTTSPWPFLDKAGQTTFRQGELYEAGLNLSAFPGLAGECFATVVDESRASAGNTAATSPFATLKDFILGAFQPCVATIQTTPSSNSITLGDTVTDHAVVTGTGAGTPTGKVKFFICSPGQLNASGQCETGGTQVTGGSSGGDTTGETLTPVSGEPTKSEATSGSFAPTTVGTWCWRGEYVPAAGSQYKSGSDFATTECVNVATVAISTAQTFTVKDSATITPSGPGATVGGSVRFRLYPNTGCTGLTTLVDETKTVSSSSSAVTVETTPATITAPGYANLSWLVEYTHTGTSTPKDVTSSCATEHAVLTISNG